MEIGKVVLIGPFFAPNHSRDRDDGAGRGCTCLSDTNTVGVFVILN